MIKENIKKDVTGLFKDFLKNDLDWEQLTDDHFFKKGINLPAIHLVALIIKLEEMYGIQFSEKDLSSNLVFSLNGLCQLISSKRAIEH